MDLPVPPTHVVVLKSTTVDSGALCVMTSGLPQTLVWLVVNLDFLLPVPAGPQVVLEGEYFLREVLINGTSIFFSVSDRWLLYTGHFAHN